jgi:GNAT superfamily N-acetyltransferase
MGNYMQFNDYYREQIPLKNDSQIRLRLIRPDDKKHMVKAFESLSTASRYKRFFGTKKVLTERELRYFTETDQYNHFALGAFELDENKKEIGVEGVARFIRLPTDKECAEVGITVIDSAQGKGIGRLLLVRMFSAAIERGIKRLRFECLPENQDMERLVSKLTDHVKFEREDGLLIAEIVIPEACPTTNQYPMDVLEDLSKLIRNFSSQAFILYTDFSVGVFKRALDNATQYKIKNDESLLSAALYFNSIDISKMNSYNSLQKEINQTNHYDSSKYSIENNRIT